MQNGSRVRIQPRRPRFDHFAGEIGTVVEYLRNENQYCIRLDVPCGLFTRFFANSNELKQLSQEGKTMTVQELIDELTLLMVGEAEVYIESEDRTELTIGRVVIDLDGDVIIEFEREVNDARTN